MKDEECEMCARSSAVNLPALPSREQAGGLTALPKWLGLTALPKWPES